MLTSTHAVVLLVFAGIALLPKSAVASCCFSFTCQPVQLYKPAVSSSNSSSSNGSSSINNAPPSFSLTLTASSQFAVNTPGEVYLALITFPSDYVISAIPSGCVSVSINAVNCTASGMSRFVVNFPDIYISDGNTSVVPKLGSVDVNGELCGLQSSCPILSPSTPTLNPTSTVSAMATVPSSWPTITSSPSASPAGSQPPPSSACPSSSTSNTMPNGNGNSPNGSGKSSSSAKINTGLIVGLTLALVLLALMTSICILRRNNDKNLTAGSGAGGLLAFLGLRHKGSRLSRGSVGVDHGPGSGRGSNVDSLESGQGHGVRSQTGSDIVSPSEKYDPAALQTTKALAVKRGLMNERRTTAAAVSNSATGSGSSSGIVPLGMTLINIPEQSEHRHQDTSGLDYFETENMDDIERGHQQESSDAAAVSADQQPLQRPGPPDFSSTLNRSGKKMSWVATGDGPATVAATHSRDHSRSSRLHRAVTAASSKLESISRSVSPSIDQHTHRAGSPASLSSRFLQSGIPMFMRPPRSAHRAPSSSVRPIRGINLFGNMASGGGGGGGSGSGNGVITTIRPEHHQQQLRQLQLEYDLEVHSNQQPVPYIFPGYGQNTTTRTILTDKDAFTNPGPPPLPPPLAAAAAAAAATTSAAPSSRKVYTQPIHIRPQHHNPGLYGYM